MMKLPGMIRKKIKLIGFRRFIISIVKIMFFKVLGAIYGFQAWHSNCPYDFRPYKEVITDLVNELKCEVVVEVGCGLGEIAYRVDARYRYGIDVDERVLKAARILYGKKVRFILGGLDMAATIPEKNIDALLLIGWLHVAGDIALIRDQLKLVLKNKTVKYIIVDKKISQKAKQIVDDLLIDLADSIKELSDRGENDRSILLYQVRNNVKK